MTNRLELNWKLDGFVDEQRYYCSETAIDVNNLPLPKAVLAGDVRFYVDTDIDVGKTYYVVVSSIKGNIEKVSQVIEVVAGGDPHWDKVVSLLHFDGDLVDATGKNTFYFNGLSSYSGGLFGQGVNPDGDYCKRVQSDGQWQFLNGDPVTVELFFKPTGTPASNAPIFISSNNLQAGISAFRRLALYQMVNNTLALEYGDQEDVVVINTPLSYAEFQHLAITLDSGIFKVFHKGVLVHEGYYPVIPTSFSEITLGGMRDIITADARQRTVRGVIDEFRITKGVARYIGNFTPPDAPFPNC